MNKEERSRNTIFQQYRWTVQVGIYKNSISERSLPENCSIIDVMVAPDSEQLYLCMKCGSEIPNSALLCCICHHQYETSPDCKTMYNIPNRHPENIPLIKLGEIIGVNPNSYSSIKKALWSLILQTESDE